MIKCINRRSVQILFALKHIITSNSTQDIYLIIISAANLITLVLMLKFNSNQFLKLIKCILLLELCFYDHLFTPPIIASLNFNIRYKIVVLVYYCFRTSFIYFQLFQIIDWVYLGILFVSYIYYIYSKEIKQINGKTQITSEKRISYLNTQPDYQDLFDLFNLLPFGICILDDKHNIINSNYKAKKYCSIIKEDSLQSQLFMIIQKACLQQMDKISLINSSEDQVSEFQAKRLQSFSQTRKKALSQQKQYNNLIDMSQIINKYKANQGGSDSSNQHVLKFKDSTTKKTYEIKIYDISQGIMICIQNISTKERQFEIRERFRFQSMLINSFSHELKTPLNCSLALLQILELELKSHKSQQSNQIEQLYLKPAIISNKKLLHQINDILDYANFEASTFQLRPTQFQISNIIQKIDYYYKNECQQKQINFVVQNCDEITINNDFDRIIQILVNLLNNSVKFTKQNGLIQFSINRIGSIYTFEVFDTGCGISVEKLYLINKILQNHETDIFKKGYEEYIQYVGLGLKVSSQIAQQLCNKSGLIITSSLNQFTKVRFCVQDLNTIEEIFAIPTDEFIQLPYQSKIQKQSHYNLILIVDDIPFNHLAFITILKYFNIKCDSAYDGSMAIQMVKNKYDTNQGGYKLIFMDIDMPGINGYQCSKEISCFLKQKNIVSIIIMCSAFNSKENIDLAYKSGINDILSKPIDTQQLKKILRKYYF